VTDGPELVVTIRRVASWRADARHDVLTLTFAGASVLSHRGQTMATSVTFSKVVPILRIFDMGKARQFYVDYLGFRIDWEHRFSEGAPLYMQVSRGSLVLHLSEHHGDGTPGSVVYVETRGLRALHAELRTMGYRSLNPGLEVDEIGTCMTLLDPLRQHAAVERTARRDERVKTGNKAAPRLLFSEPCALSLTGASETSTSADTFSRPIAGSS
jgi:catechol 2,3-dioxygenase-like lactoylglutathione lyase family enzyme